MVANTHLFNLTHSDLFMNRKQRVFTPESNKDSCYWAKRRRNNEAAKRSREKRRINDLLLESKVIELKQENDGLKSQLKAIYQTYGIRGEEALKEISERKTTTLFPYPPSARGPKDLPDTPSSHLHPTQVYQDDTHSPEPFYPTVPYPKTEESPMSPSSEYTFQSLRGHHQDVIENKDAIKLNTPRTPIYQDCQIGRYPTEVLNLSMRTLSPNSTMSSGEYSDASLSSEKSFGPGPEFQAQSVLPHKLRLKFSRASSISSSSSKDELD